MSGKTPRHETLPAYQVSEFMESAAARPLRILAEYLDPLYRLRRAGVADTIVMFGSARMFPLQQSEAHLRRLESASRPRTAAARHEHDRKLRGTRERRCRHTRQRDGERPGAARRFDGRDDECSAAAGRDTNQRVPGACLCAGARARRRIVLGALHRAHERRAAARDRRLHQLRRDAERRR